MCQIKCNNYSEWMIHTLTNQNILHRCIYYIIHRCDMYIQTYTSGLLSADAVHSDYAIYKILREIFKS